MRYYAIIKYFVLATGLAFLAAQAIPVNWMVRAVSAQSGKRSFWEDKSVPQPVAAIVRRSCGNCHSNATDWPWYGKVAPVSWMLAKDVSEARRNINFSEWLDPRKPYLAAGEAAQVCEAVSSGEMPLPRYLMLHPDARLSGAEKRAICQWSEGLLKPQGQ
jgi:hypothetical protein